MSSAVVVNRQGRARPAYKSSAEATDSSRRKRKRRSGTVLVFAVFLMTVLFAFLALAVDLGYLCMVRTELQRTADVGALGGAGALYRPPPTLETATYYMPPDPTAARLAARQFVRQNPTGGRFVDVDLNSDNDPSGDIVIGQLANPSDPSESLDATSGTPNTVCVRVPLSADGMNGPIQTFFARVLGVQTAEMSASAMATIWYPALLPFATSEDNWNSLSTGGTGDDYAYRPGLGSFGVVPGDDGVAEIAMFPGPWGSGEDLPPGNFGVIQIGPDGLVLNALRRQIDMGPSVSDMSVHGGRLQAGDQVPGRTGLKSATKHAFLGGSADSRNFSGILGRVRQLPLYESAVGNGANCTFTLAGFVVVRVMAVNIDGRWRTDYRDTDGNDVHGIKVQPVTETQQLVQVQLTR